MEVSKFFKNDKLSSLNQKNELFERLTNFKGVVDSFIDDEKTTTIQKLIEINDPATTSMFLDNYNPDLFLKNARGLNIFSIMEKVRKEVINKYSCTNFIKNTYILNFKIIKEYSSRVERIQNLKVLVIRYIKNNNILIPKNFPPLLLKCTQLIKSDNNNNNNKRKRQNDTDEPNRSVRQKKINNLFLKH